MNRIDWGPVNLPGICRGPAMTHDPQPQNNFSGLQEKAVRPPNPTPTIFSGGGWSPNGFYQLFPDPKNSSYQPFWGSGCPDSPKWLHINVHLCFDELLAVRCAPPVVQNHGPRELETPISRCARDERSGADYATCIRRKEVSSMEHAEGRKEGRKEGRTYAEVDCGYLEGVFDGLSSISTGVELTCSGSTQLASEGTTMCGWVWKKLGHLGWLVLIPSGSLRLVLPDERTDVFLWWTG